MAQGSSMSMSKVTTGEKIVLGAAAVYFIWVFLPFWYKFSISLGGFGVSDTINGFRGLTILAWLLAVAAIVEIVLRGMMGMKMALPAKPGLLHLGAAGLALLFTLIGLAAKPTGYGISWGIFVAILIALVWAYGAYMMYNEPETAPTAPPADTTPPGFTS